MTDKHNSLDSFEKAYARLEQILEKMNSGSIPLDESLKLYEEADRLILSCSTKLNEAEKTVEMLVKNRTGDLLLNEQGKPVLQEFAPTTNPVFTSKIKDENECPF